MTGNATTLLALLLTCASAACNGRPPPGDGASTMKAAADSSASGRPAIVLPAARPPATHLVVLLHGVGADAASFKDVGVALAPALPRAEMLVPDGFHPFDAGGPGRQWFSLGGVNDAVRPSRVREAGAEVSAWIDGQLAQRGLAADRVAIVGFSQGAMVAAWLALHRTPRPAAVVMLSGRVAEDGVPTPGASGPPVLVAHGQRDPRIPVSVVDGSAAVLSAWGARVTTRVYPGLAHEVDGPELAEVRAFLASALAAGGPPADEGR